MSTMVDGAVFVTPENEWYLLSVGGQMLEDGSRWMIGYIIYRGNLSLNQIFFKLFGRRRMPTFDSADQFLQVNMHGIECF